MIGLPCMSAAQSDQQKFVPSTQGILTPRGASSSSRGQSPAAAPIAGGAVSRVLMWHTVDLEDAEHNPLIDWRHKIAAFLHMLRYRFLAYRRITGCEHISDR